MGFAPTRFGLVVRLMRSSNALSVSCSRADLTCSYWQSGQLIRQSSLFKKRALASFILFGFSFRGFMLREKKRKDLIIRLWMGGMLMIDTNVEYSRCVYRVILHTLEFYKSYAFPFHQQPQEKSTGPD